MITGTTEELLGRILQTMTPCPEICDNTDPYGTGVYDIRSGLRIPELREPPCFCYTMSTDVNIDEGDPFPFVCTVNYIDCNGSTIEFAQSGSTIATGSTVINTICIKKVISYGAANEGQTCKGSLIKNGPCGQGNIC